MDEKRRLAFKMKLKPGCEEEYRRRHAALWPEMRDVLKKYKVGNYSIFYCRSRHIVLMFFCTFYHGHEG